MRTFMRTSVILLLLLTGSAVAQDGRAPAAPAPAPKLSAPNMPVRMGADEQRSYENRLKLQRMAWNAEHTSLVLTAAPEEYKKWVFEILIAPTRSTTITAPFDDGIAEVSLGNPGAFIITPPSDESDGYFFLMPAASMLGVKTTLTVLLRSGVRVTFDVTVGRIETAVVNIDLQIFGREKVDPWIQRRVAAAMARVDETMKRRERELDAEAQTRATATLLKAIIQHHEVESLERTNRSANIILRTVSKARIGNWIYLRFLVKNNSGKSYDFARAQIDVVRVPTGLTSIFSSAEETRQPLANQIYFIENPRIPAGEERYGVLGFPIPEEWKSGDIFDVTVSENGLQRNITITDIDLAWD